VAGQSAGRRVLFRRDIDDLQPRPILGTEGGFEPVISPDGREVAFATGDRRLMRVSIDGGAPVPLVGVTTPIGMAWSAKHGLVLGMPMHSQTIRGLSLVSTRGDTEVRPLMDSVEGMHHDPLVLPDGMTALYVDVADSGPASHGVGVASLDDGAVERVADLPVFGDGGVIGLKDGILYFLSPSRDLMGVRFDLAKRRIVGTPVRLTDPLGAARDVIMAPDGTVVMRVAPSAFQAASVSALGVATPLHPDTLEVISGRYSPDGRRILLFESRADKPAWWIQDVATGTRAKVEVKGMPALPRASWMPDGRGLIAVQIGGSHVLSVPVNAGDTAKVLGRFEGMQLNTASLSPDGKTLVLGAGIGAGEKDILTARLGADTVPTPFVASTANEVAASFSPDGRWIVFASDESGRYEVYVLPFPGPGPRIQISDSGGGQPIWGRDGRRIYYRSGQAMMAADLGGPANSLTVSNRRLLFRGYFFQPDPGLFAAVYDVSPDGRHFIMGRPLSNSNRSEIVVWKNWHEEVKQRLK
jgi:WD40 repeat protein